jgi:hypothetical protein
LSLLVELAEEGEELGSGLGAGVLGAVVADELLPRIEVGEAFLGGLDQLGVVEADVDGGGDLLADALGEAGLGTVDIEDDADMGVTDLGRPCEDGIEVASELVQATAGGQRDEAQVVEGAAGGGVNDVDALGVVDLAEVKLEE